MKKICALFFVFALIVTHVNALKAQNVISPEEFFGFKPGTDKKLFNYEKLVDYLKLLEQSSPKIKLAQIGRSPMGKPMYVVCISSADNIKNLDKLKEINRQLALNPDLSTEAVQKMAEEGKVFILATLSMHSTEVAPTQSLPLIAYDLATTSDPEKLKCLNEVVYMAVPCHNPDGMDMVVENYMKYLGTEFEGSSLPRVYHKYAGHDNNRDFISLTQEDTRAIDGLYSKEWFPQVMVEKHQMGSGGVRYFIPPPHDPIAENVDAGIWNWVGVFGSNMMKDMTADGLKGISQNYLFDDYWPGSTETCIWKNVIGFLTEAASVHIASPIYCEENELETGGKGLSEYKKSINFPEPWKGGWWRLGDIVNLETSSTNSILKTAAANRAAILQFRNFMCRNEVKKGMTEVPYYYILPAAQHDRSELVALVNLLMEHGIAVYQLQGDILVSGLTVAKGSIVVPLAQPFRSFIKEILEKQKYPVRHYTPDGEVMKPYDIASWSLPLHRGVNCFEVDSLIPDLGSKMKLVIEPFWLKTPLPDNYFAARFPVSNNESFKAIFIARSKGLEVTRNARGDFFIKRDGGKKPKLDSLVNLMGVSPEFLPAGSEIPSNPVKIARIALVETFMHDMDAGWTRFIFDTYTVPYKILHPGEFEKTDFIKDFDLVIFPDNEKSILMEGKNESDGQIYPTSYPPEYTKGIGKKGMAKLMDFFNQGGRILSWGASTELFTGLLSVKAADTSREFRLPVRDISKRLTKEGLFCPGSFVSMNLVSDNPLTAGMPSSTGIFFRGEPVFATSIPCFDMDRRVIGKFPEENILLSGYCEKPEKLADKSVMVWLKKGKGQLILYGFGPQFRASTQATYKLLFNPLLLP
ncbi:MAG: M14 family metallopeptidase [Bacteroidetes bacterium]|nr:M14 family metallopeptidase [Bacteroidota bacterium]